jgi:hypothetical protein
VQLLLFLADERAQRAARALTRIPKVSALLYFLNKLTRRGLLRVEAVLSCDPVMVDPATVDAAIDPEPVPSALAASGASAAPCTPAATLCQLATERTGQWPAAQNDHLRAEQGANAQRTAIASCCSCPPQALPLSLPYALPAGNHGSLASCLPCFSNLFVHKFSRLVCFGGAGFLWRAFVADV